MKKWSPMMRALALVTALLLSVSLIACKEEKPEAGGAYSDNLEALLADIYAVGGYSDMLTGMLEAPADEENVGYTRLQTLEITAQNEEYYLGKTGISYECGIASEPTMNPTLYSLCLLKAGEGTTAAELAQTLKKSANPRKWVCTGLSDNDVYVAYSGDIVMLVMSAKDGEALTNAFYSLTGN